MRAIGHGFLSVHLFQNGAQQSFEFTKPFSNPIQVLGLKCGVTSCCDDLVAAASSCSQAPSQDSVPAEAGGVPAYCEAVR